ncbi:MAG: HPr family phosphocarrier protein [Pseudomonadales bacterium]|nr:HPr family phosphocarrier protein [Pseudomonadales bacterium]
MHDSTSTVKIINQKGLHARASIKLSELASSFESNISLTNDTTQADAKNILQLMMLAASRGSTLTLHCQGTDALNAEQAIHSLINNYFEESH